jgi:hypothetical protein
MLVSSPFLLKDSTGNLEKRLPKDRAQNSLTIDVECFTFSIRFEERMLAQIRWMSVENRKSQLDD